MTWVWDPTGPQVRWNLINLHLKQEGFLSEYPFKPDSGMLVSAKGWTYRTQIPRLSAAKTM